MYPFQWASELTKECFKRGLKDVLERKVNLSRWKKDNQDFLDEQGIGISNGATKICIVSGIMDWVVKMGFFRSSWKDDSIDFCQVEHKKYIAARKAGVARYLAPVHFVDNIEGVNVYIQEKECTEDGSIRDSIQEYYESEYSTEYYSDYSEMDEEETIIAILGTEKGVNDFINFVLDNEINDLHALNWGINSVGQAVLIDYSGYF